MGEKIPQNEQLKYYKREPAPGESIGSNETAIDPLTPASGPTPSLQMDEGNVNFNKIIAKIKEIGTANKKSEE